MALETVEVPVSFSGGVDTKTDPKQIGSGKLAGLENGTFVSPKRIRKRNGFTARARTIETGGSIAAGKRLFNFRDETLLADGSNLYARIASTGKWGLKGALPSCVVRSSPVLRSSNQPSASDSAFHYASGLSVYAWEDSAGGVYYSVIDETTGARIVDRAVVDSGANCRSPKVLAFQAGTVIVITYVSNSGAALNGCVISTTTPATLGAPASLILSLNTTNRNYDAQVFNGLLYLAWNHSSANTVGIASFNSALTLQASRTTAADGASACISLFNSAVDSQAIVVAATSTKTFYRVYPYALGSLVSSGNLDTDASLSGVVANISGVRSGSNGWVYYTLSNATSSNYLIRRVTLNGSGASYAVGTPAVWCRSVGLVGKAFVYGALPYVPAGFTSPLQASYFVLDDTTRVIAKLVSESGLAGGFPTRATLTEVNPDAASPTAFRMVFPLKESQFADNGTVRSQLGLQQAIVDLDDATYAFSSAEIGGGLHVAGGALQLYSGGAPIEHGFHLYPEAPTATLYPFGGSLSLGRYAWNCSYEWLDAGGVRHRSAPSGVTATLEDVTFTGDTSSGAATILNITDAVASKLLPGMTVKGPGIPVGTTILTIAGSGLIMSANATATGTTVPFRALTASYALACIINESKTVQLTSIKYFWGYATSVSGSADIVLAGATGAASIVAGQTLYCLNMFGGAGTAKVLSTSTNAVTGVITVTTDTTAILTWTTPLLIRVSYVMSSGTCTAGSPNITLASAGDVAYAASHVGAIFDDSGLAFPASTTIVSAAGTTIVLSANSSANIGATGALIYSAGSTHLVVGQTLSGTGIATGTTISALSTTGAASTLTLSQYPTATGTSITITSTGMALMTLPTLRLTSRTAADVQICTYRTQANGTTYNRVSSATTPTLNSSATDTVSFTDIIPDLVAIGNDPLYTTGGVLENIQAPPCVSAVIYRNRVVLIDSTTGTIWFSKEVIAGEPVEFNDALTLVVDPSGPKPVGLGVLDDKLIIFKPDEIFVIAGQGPDSTGSQNDLLAATKLPSAVGCTEPRSIVRGGPGLMFRCRSGIVALDRGLNIQNIGAEVEGHTDGATVLSADTLGADNQVRFLLSNGRIVVFDDFVDQWAMWSSDTNAFAGAAAAVVSGGVYQVLGTNGEVCYEDTTTSLDTTVGDGTVWTSMTVTTPWLSLAGIQGFQRVRRAIVLGDWESSHTLSVAVAFDFGASFVNFASFAAPTISTPYQWRVHLGKQKCEAVQITISDSANGANGTGVGFSLSGITLEVAKKKGAFKLAAAASGS